MQIQPVEESYKVRARDNLVYGPVTLSALLEWARDERVLADTWIHSASDNGWQKAATIPALHEVLRATSHATLGFESPTESYKKIGPDNLHQFPLFPRLPVKQLEQLRSFGHS